MDKLKLIIVEDEEKEVELLKDFLSRFEQIDIVAIVDNYLDCVLKIHELKPDILLLDLFLNGENHSKKIIESLINCNLDTEIIISSSNKDCIHELCEYFKLNVLYKPIDFEKLKSKIEYISKQSKTNSKEKYSGFINSMEKIEFNFSNKKLFYFPMEILYCESNGKYTNIFLTELINGKFDKFMFTKNLSEVEKKLPSELFTRIHNKYLINNNFKTQIDKYSNTCYLMANGNEIKLKIGKTKKI